MIAVPIGPRPQRRATAAAPAYLDRRGRPAHPRELPDHACLRGRLPRHAQQPIDHETPSNRDDTVHGSTPQARLSASAERHPQELEEPPTLFRSPC